MKILDIRQIGPITSCDEVYLSELIAMTCSIDKIKHELSLQAQHDFGWINGLLIAYVLENLMSQSSTRVSGHISSGEWLCGIFTSGQLLSLEHTIILMSFVNARTSPLMVNRGLYCSGKDTWENAPSAIRTILDLLDDSIIDNEYVHVVTPDVEPIDDMDTLEMLEKLPVDEMRRRVRVIWSDKILLIT